MSQAMTMGGYPDNMQFGRSSPVAGPYNFEGYSDTERKAFEDQLKLEAWQKKLDALAQEGRTLMSGILNFSEELPCFGDILTEMEGFSEEIDKHDLPFLADKKP